MNLVYTTIKHALYRSNDGVISLLAIFGIGVFALSASLAVAVGSAAGLAQNRNVVSGDQSFYTAEAGTFEGALQYRHATSSYTGGSPELLNNTSEGSISVTSLNWPYVHVNSYATGQTVRRSVSHVITVFPEGFAFDYAVYAQNNLIMGGNLEINGGVFANDGIEFNGNSAEINGNAYSPLNINENQPGANINGEIFEGVDPIPPPELLIDPYLAYANASSTYFATTSSAQSYVNGNMLDHVVVVIADDGVKASIGNSNTHATGTIVKTGNMDLKGGSYIAFDNFAAIVVYGDLKISGGTYIKGIVYVTGETSFGAGNNVIDGSLISAGGASVTDLTGNATINFDPVVTANWQNLAGLDTTSNEEPEVILWEEE